MSLPEETIKKWREDVNKVYSIQGSAHRSITEEERARIEGITRGIMEIARRAPSLVHAGVWRVINDYLMGVRMDLHATTTALEEDDYPRAVDNLLTAIENLLGAVREIVFEFEMIKIERSSSNPEEVREVRPEAEPRVVELLKTLPPEFRIEKVERVGIIRPRLRVTVSTRA